MHSIRHAILAGALVVCTAAGAAQTNQPPAAPPNGAPVSDVVLPNAYVIGPGDVLGIVFWREPTISGDVTVLPDGRITIPLLNEIQAAGLKPEELRARIVEAAKKFVTDPTATVVVRQVNSRRVYITGMVAKGGPYPIYAPITVLQLIATAGGLLEYAKDEEIVIVRTDPNGKQSSYRFNYKDVTRQRNLSQNIELKPGDTVIVR